jgi:hypothetical protein
LQTFVEGQIIVERRQKTLQTFVEGQIIVGQIIVEGTVLFLSRFYSYSLRIFLTSSGATLP